jgi:superfamily II DNA/RNA helicase
VLIILPTRELAQQTVFNFYKLGFFAKQLKICVLYGGDSDRKEQYESIHKGCDILIGTPGKLIDFYERNFYSLRQCKYLVLDEADRCLEMGFDEQIMQIVFKQDLGEHQSLLFSATFPYKVQNMVKKFTKDPIRITIKQPNKQIEQQMLHLKESEKMAKLLELLQPDKKVIIFCETKQKCSEIALELNVNKINCEALHGNMEQSERNVALKRFQGECNVLVATDCAQRGLDLNVALVINYDLPKNVEDYIHRVGRTGRVG